MIESIYDKALELIKDIGVNFKMDDIAKEMGISKKTIYKHYPSKEVLIKRMIDECDLTISSSFRSISYNNNLTEINKLFLMLDIVPKEAVLYTRKVLEGLKHYYPNQAVSLEEHIFSRKEEIRKQYGYASHSSYMSNMPFESFYYMYISIFELWQDDSEKDIQELKDITVRLLQKGIVKENE